MKQLLRILWVLLALVWGTNAGQAGERGPGPYSGIVLFDRWGGCTLYSGVYVMYIAEPVKRFLLPYKDQAIQINATDVFQSQNPGDGLINKFQYVGAAPLDPDQGSQSGLRLTVLPDFQPGKKPAFWLEVSNQGQTPVTIRRDSLALTLLTNVRASGKFKPNRPSFALLTRAAFSSVGGGVSLFDGQRRAVYWNIGKQRPLLRSFALQPQQQQRIKIFMDISPGEYEFLCGYGGGVHETECIASNRIAFDARKDGKAIMAARSN